jgi:hypothetical protein
MSTPDLTLASAPRISASGFRAILLRHASPAAPEAAACYAAFVAKGIDPAVGLAIFQHESGFGLFGVARTNRSWGNVRGAGGSFVKYSTWTAGAAGLAALLVLYATNKIRPGTTTSTIRTFPYVYAPSADGNAPAAYGAAVLALVTTWSATYPPIARHVSAKGLRHLYHLDAARRLVIENHNPLTFTAACSANVRIALSTKPATRYTFARLLSGSHRGRYVHVSDDALTFH